MIKKIIKGSVNYYIGRNAVRVGATNRRKLGDLLADALLLIPKRTSFGWVSWSVYQQAEELFKREGEKLMKMPRITLKGHSLGGSVSILLAIVMLEQGYKKPIRVYAYGSPKVLGSETRIKLAKLLKATTWRVRHRDIVCFLGWWKEPIHTTKREGCKRRDILDWDITEHSMY